MNNMQGIKMNYANASRWLLLAVPLIFSSSPQAVEIDDILTFQHSCSPSLNLRAQDMTQDQAEWICRELGDEEQRFHNLLQTGWQPVADDYNETLELVVFDSTDDWKFYGYELYGVRTDNGGTYIEGDPNDPNNQARFFAHEAEWKRPNFEVLNLRHEYVHYLDARFNRYGGFGYYPDDRTVWWSEGLAEYIAYGACYSQALNDITRDINANQQPTLADILYVDYNARIEMIYSWTYTVHRFLNETGRNATWLTIAQALRNPDWQQAMDTLNAELDQLIANDSQAYQTWVTDELLPKWEQDQASGTCL